MKVTERIFHKTPRGTIAVTGRGTYDEVIQIAAPRQKGEFHFDYDALTEETSISIYIRQWEGYRRCCSGEADYFFEKRLAADCRAVLSALDEESRRKIIKGEELVLCGDAPKGGKDFKWAEKAYGKGPCGIYIHELSFIKDRDDMRCTAWGETDMVICAGAMSQNFRCEYGLHSLLNVYTDMGNGEELTAASVWLNEGLEMKLRNIWDSLSPEQKKRALGSGITLKAKKMID